MSAAQAPLPTLQDKVAVVTGGASGIGFAMAQRFLAGGASVVVADIEAPMLDQAADLLDAGDRCLTVRCDVSSAHDVAALRDAVVEQFGTAHLVCNNAGVGTTGSIDRLSLADWEWVIGVNLFGVIHGIDAFLPLMLEQDEGHIVNTSSNQGLTTGPGWAAYGASKHAVVVVTEVLRAELEQRGANVGASVLCPGAVATNIMSAHRNRPGADPSRAKLRDPIGKVPDGARERFPDLQTPDEVADLVAAAVAENRFGILTHPGNFADIEARFTRLLDEFRPR